METDTIIPPYRVRKEIEDAHNKPYDDKRENSGLDPSFVESIITKYGSLNAENQLLFQALQLNSQK